MIPRRGEWAPLHVIAWRFPWVIVARTARLLYVAATFCGFGLAMARRAWRDTQ